MSSLTYELPELSEAEKRLPVSKYYTDYPLHKPNPLYRQLLSTGSHEAGECTFSGTLV
ncbi:MAG: hypothetical protein V8Q93_11850 [Blautia faecis]